jgi:ComF family protein
VAVSALALEYPPPTAVERVLDLVFPPLCVGCRRIGRWICDRCWQKMPWLFSHACSGCRRRWMDRMCFACAGQSTALDALIAVTDFSDIGREAIHALKFNGRHAIAGPLGRMMAHVVAGIEVDAVCPVPLHPKRRRERGYDQAALLARSVARTLDRPYRPDALRRIRPTAQQALLDRVARQANVEGAFRAKDDVREQTILLIDDVSTTGATILAAARALRESGCAGVNGLVFAHGT